MKNDTSSFDKFDEHSRVLIKFKPYETIKQIDVNITIEDSVFPSPLPYVTPCLPVEKDI